MKHDFYYSKKHDEHMASIGGYIGMPEKKDTFVNGIKYTEMIESGKTPVTKKNFGDDLKLVYSGHDFKITYKTKQHNGNEF